MIRDWSQRERDRQALTSGVEQIRRRAPRFGASMMSGLAWCGTMSGGGPPDVQALSFAIGDILGGQTLSITVDDSTGATGAAIDGSALTGFTIVDPTTVRGEIPAHAAAASLDVTVTNAFGTGTLPASFEFYDPSAIWDLYLDGHDYTLGTWVARKGTAPTEATNPPAVGNGADRLNAWNTVKFDGTNDKLTGNATSNYLTATQWVCFELFNANAIDTSNANPELNDGLWSETSADNVGVHLNSTGPKVETYAYDTNARHDDASISTGTWVAHFGKFDNVKLYSKLGSGSWSSGTACTPIGLGGNVRIGSDYTASNFFDGRLAVFALAKVIPTDPQLAKFMTYINARFAQSL